MYKARTIKSSLLEKISKRTSIETTLRVSFQMEWLTMNINPDREATISEWNQADKWAIKMTKWVMKDFKEWEKNGRPK